MTWKKDAKVAIDVPSLSEKEEPCDTLQLPNGEATHLRETTPKKKGIKVDLNDDSEQAKDLKPKVSNKGILAGRRESFVSSGPQTPPLVIKKPRLFFYFDDFAHSLTLDPCYI